MLRWPFRMTERSSIRYLKASPTIIRLAMIPYIRFPLTLHKVEDLLDVRRIEFRHETLRYWWNQSFRCAWLNSGASEWIGC
jgi:putative transposase